jgi:hypothetical protein
MLKVTNKTDRQLFFSSTKISAGDGRNTPFWEARWLDGVAPKDLAPNLFNLAHFKTRSVHDELRNNNWISNLQNINSTSLMEEFILLFMALELVVLNDHKDEISWTWTANGMYYVASAYECQFLGAISPFLAKQIWQAKSEAKCKFFAWLLMHNRVLTADNMSKRNWTCDPFCSFCLCNLETLKHLFSQCNYTEAVSNLTAPRFGLDNFSSDESGWTIQLDSILDCFRI